MTGDFDPQNGRAGISIGNGAGSTDQKNNAIAIGNSAGNINQNSYSVAIGEYAANQNQGYLSVAIGAGSAYDTQGNYSVAVGEYAGSSLQADRCIAIGGEAGQTGQGGSTGGSIAIGFRSGNNNQKDGSIAIGQNAGRENQNNRSVAIGSNAGSNGQGIIAYPGTGGGTGACVAIGNAAGNTGQESFCVAIGAGSGSNTQRGGAVAFGRMAGNNSQGSNAVAIGHQSGQSNQGQYAIAIGYQAGQTGQPANSIVLNASGSALSGVTGSAFYVKPIRGNTGPQNLYYDPNTYEVTYATPTGSTGPLSESYTLSAPITGQTGGSTYTLICDTQDSSSSYGGFTGYDPTTGVFTNYGSNPMSLLVDWRIQAEQGNWDVTLYKGSTAYWQSQILSTYNTNSFSQSLVLPPTETAKVMYSITGPTGYTLGNTGTRINFTQLDTATGAKTFVIDHPIDNDKYLIHACLEGPEAGVYYRGKSIIPEEGETVVTLPEYVKYLATDLTIQLTPIKIPGVKRNSILESSEVNENTFTVYGEPGPFHWTVFGKRSNITVEPFKNLVDVKGEGPYTWI